MTCLTLVQTACARLGFLKPAAVVTSVDPQVQQFLALANEEGQSLSEATNWQALRKEGLFTTVAAQQQGTIATIAPGCKFIVNDTIWNRTLRMPVFGPLSPQQWQQQAAMFYQGHWNQFRIFDDTINFIPTPPAGQNCAFEYVSRNWTAAGFESFQDDNDASLLDEKLMVLGVIWRFKQAKGLDFTTDLTKYQRQLTNLIARETPKPILDLGGDIYDGVGIPVGNGVIGSSTGFLPPFFR